MVSRSDQPARLVEYYTSYTGWLIARGFMSVGPHNEVHGKSVHPGRIIWNIETPDVKEIFARWVAAGAIVIREPYSFEGLPGS